MTVLEFLLPPPPAHWDKNKETKIHQKIAACLAKPIEPAGHAFMRRALRHRHKRTLNEDLEIEEALREANSADVLMEEDEPESAKLLRSDPSKWKDQDHYAILGLSKVRYMANDEDIKRAYRRKVLKHHPDKKAAASGRTNDDSYFKCLQKAWEIMSDPKKRREWDSCDPLFDESIPSLKAKGDFFDIYTPAFAKESRFSKKPNVPELGDINSTREDVESFYSFWFDFESWRTFEMLDEEDTDNAEGRDHKRFLERKNKAARTKLKKEDNSRLIKLAEQAFSLDPRIRKFKEEERYAKDAKRREKEQLAKAAEIEAEKKAEEARIACELAEAQEKAVKDAEKAKREKAKNAVRKEKKTIKRLLRDNNNFLSGEALPDAVINQVERIEFIFTWSEIEHLEAFRTRLEDAFAFGIDALMLAFDEEHMLAEEREAAAKTSADSSETQSKDTASAVKTKSQEWTSKEITILIKAVKMFPGGTISRWEKIAEYINEHGGLEGESEEQKALPVAADRSRLQAAAAKPVNKIEIKDAPSERIEPLLKTTTVEPVSKASAPATTMMAPPNANWSAEQQLALEQAMRKYPASAFTSNPSGRWEQMANDVPGKNKNEIKNRVKELANMVKKKKAK
ncbi:hypothetical protein BATDEDRAFT_34216 [Batrachochytrium dendrobatidis JAM81]|uniref:Uncharacterized protein n=1 Tax=Batrachochytrium dendrobatidis (strain JAM81 / FGSC 10211) TaxID=684364 RepID=F4NSZ4_BATDJ|nr:uncharacterized protein BATDEDRAFT_34216 [Batrachochytrium dendrobatidis JAM81]EGF84287.1 hypothetical protein BATDEDRAFT_34216 [Batrachochytrium dendrobatidis JAM81]|eukprot:XP_006675790.1 hypothetical protein BATDEDRAFT_34216 [Batrachochytrium dendrobatidis JAM81]